MSQEPFTRFTLQKLVVAVVVALLSLSGWCLALERNKADLRDIDRIERKIDRLIDIHINPTNP